MKFLTGGIVAFAGIALLCVAVAIAYSKDRNRRTSLVADGVVTQLNFGGSHPQIEFTTRSGERVSYPQGGLIFGYREGDRVRVRYREADPSNSASLDSFGAIWFVPILLGGIGLICSVTGMLTIFSR
jgi:hypothetical protein